MGAGIPWLISKYKAYVVMRERLLSDTQRLRSNLGGAPPPAAASPGAPPAPASALFQALQQPVAGSACEKEACVEGWCAPTKGCQAWRLVWKQQCCGGFSVGVACMH